ncbi:MAG: hypothetical protein OQJ97_11040 [Rhodospirillales bacterium]|nr:hypothetical protein [Rhodospirillales bacterium]
MANWFKRDKKPKQEEEEDGPQDFFGEILELNHLDESKKDKLIHDLEDFSDTESVETEILLANVKPKDKSNPWHD